jgi:cysteine synthase A
VPEKFSEEKVIIMRAFGAEVIRTPDGEGMPGAISRARDLAASDPSSFLAAQFDNPANTDFHYETTAAEIFEQMDGRVDAITIGCGTAGTFTGVARYLKERIKKVYAVAVETDGSVLGGGPAGKHKIEGIGNSFIPGNFDRAVCDEVFKVTDDQAFGMVKELAAREGVLGGSSSGANVYAAVEIAKQQGSAWSRSFPTRPSGIFLRKFSKAAFSAARLMERRLRALRRRLRLNRLAGDRTLS